MKKLAWYETWPAAIAVLIAWVIIATSLFEIEFPYEGLLHSIGAVGWLVASVLFSIRVSLAKKLEKSFTRSHFKSDSPFFEQRLAEFADQTTSLHEASAGLILERFQNKGTQDLSEHLLKIASLAYHRFDANAVELSLYDRTSGLWSQAFVIGEPSSPNTQAMLSDGATTDLLETIGDNGQRVIKQKMEFSGSNFGSLRVEIPKTRSISSQDRRLLSLLGLSGAMLLVDAQFNKELLRLRSANEDSIKAKTGFLANLSHEIRGPLGVILNGVELTMDGLCGPVTETQVETLQMIKDNGDHLLDLVNDVLDYAKVSAGKISAKPIPLSVQEILDDLSTLVRSQAQAKGHTLKVTPVDSNMTVLCDRRHLRQIMINFLTNAIKYTPDKGEVVLGAEVEGSDRIRIWVRDSGVGIPEEARGNVFGAFERVDNKYSMGQVGTGLGMSLTKKLAEVNSGSVDFESTVGEGSRFWISLPLASEVEASEEDSSGDEVREVNGNGDSILLVDHMDETRDMYKRYLENVGFKVFAAASGRDVLKIVREEELNLAVIENDMPDIGGEDLVLALRANPRVAKMPTIVISSKAFVFDIEHLLKMGVDRCLSKPIELSELARNCRRLIDNNTREQALD